MSKAIAVIESPVDAKDKVLVYSTNANSTLRVQNRTRAATQVIVTLDNEIKVESTQTLIGKIANPSQLVCLKAWDMQCVYGITGTSTADQQVSMLSPVVKPFSVDSKKKELPKPAAGGAFAGYSVDSGQIVYLYYVVGSTAAGVKIVELTIKQGDQIKVTELPATEVEPATNLHAFAYKVEKHGLQRYVMYQKKSDKRIVFRNLGTGTEFPIEGTTACVKTTPITAVCIPPQGDRKVSHVVAYFLLITKVDETDQVVIGTAHSVVGNNSLSFNKVSERASAFPGYERYTSTTQMAAYLEGGKVVLFGFSEEGAIETHGHDVDEALRGDD